MERDIENSLRENKDVEASYEIIYDEESRRPDVIVVNVTTDGETRSYLFENYRKDD